MEPVVGELQGLSIGSSSLLGLPEPCPWDSDDELLGIGGIKPKSSPIPRRRSSLSCSDDDCQPPPSSSRRVSFADAFGLSLVLVKQFDTGSMCDPADLLEVELKDTKEYFLKLLFALPLTLEELLFKVQEQKVDLEGLELLPGTTTLKGTVRVLNMCFDKLVYVRTSLDFWSSHFDLLAEYMPESSQGDTDCFSFKLTLVPPFGEQGARVDFCIRYETPFGTFWANNNGQNYVLFCHEKPKEKHENEKLKPKSCLKPGRHSSITSTTSNAKETPEIILNHGIAAATELVGIKEEKIQEEHKLKEEYSRNCSRRKRRKAARMAKLQQYFQQKDEKDLQQTEKDTDEADVPVPARDEALLNLSTPQTNVASLLAESRRTEGQKSSVESMDVDRNQVPVRQIQTQEKDKIPAIQPEVIHPSKSLTRRPTLGSVNSHKSVVYSQLLDGGQNKETVTNQSVSLKCQSSDKSTGNVEKAWECFEKCALERMGSNADTNSSVGNTNHVYNTLLENNQGPQSFGHCYTFGTIVAPLYHQVFERMENDRKGVKNSASKADESAGKPNNGSMRVVTYPTVETRSNPEISAKHVNNDDYHGACIETFPVYLHNTKSATGNALSGPNVKATLVAEIAFQDAALPGIPDSLLDDRISDSEPSQAVTEKQESPTSLPSVSWEESTTDQTQQTSEIVFLQSEHSDDTEYSPDNKLTRYSRNTLQQGLTCTDNAILSTQSEADLAAAKPSPAIVPENPQSTDRSVTQTSFETQINDDKMQDEEAQTSQQTLNTHIKCLKEIDTPMPDFTSDISANAAPKMSQSEASSPSQDLTQASIQPQIPATVFFTQSPEAAEAAVPELQTTDDTNVIQKTTNTCQNSDRSNHIGSETESNSSYRDDGVDSWKKIENEAETIQTETVHVIPEQASDDRISSNLTDVTQINENKEHGSSPLNFPDEVTDYDEHLVKDMAISSVSSNPDNPEDSSEEDDDEEEQQEDMKENVQLKNPGKYEGQELTYMTENQSKEVKEISEIEKPLEEKEEEDQEDHVEKEEPESYKKVELGNEDKFKDGSCYTEDYEEEVKKDDKEKDAEPRRNGVELEDKKVLEAEIKEQEMVRSAVSLATIQSIPNIDSFIQKVHLYVEQEQQKTGLEQMFEEPVSGHSIGEEEKEIICGIGSSQEAPTLNGDLGFSGQVEEVENNSECTDREKNVCRQTDNEHVVEDAIGEVDAMQEKQDCLNEKSENMDDRASTESLTDDEMELCLLRLKNTQQSGLKDGISIGKRLSISRTCQIPSPMPSISEYIDEDQPNALLDDLSNEDMRELERATRPRLDKEEEVIEPNLLWWREFFSSDNMPKIIVYILLFVVLLITIYICDFIACFGLYLLALYWLYFQVQGEPLKGT